MSKDTPVARLKDMRLSQNTTTGWLAGQLSYSGLHDVAEEIINFSLFNSDSPRILRFLAPQYLGSVMHSLKYVYFIIN